MTTMELNFIREDIPKITRAGGSGREAEPWENHLASLKETPGESFRVWTYDKRTSALSRMSNVRERLIRVVPHENWQLAVRTVPGSEQYGVYVAYNGTLSPEEVTERAQKRQERSERVRAARAASAANGSASGVSATPSAKERVAAAKAARK